GQRRRRRGDLRLGRAERGVLLIDDLLRRRSGLEELRAAPQILLRPVAGGLGVAQIRLSLVDLARLRRRQQVLELTPRLLQETLRLIDRGAVVGVVLLEQRLALGDTIAARDPDRGEQPRLGRSDLDEVGLGVALPRDRLRRLRAEQNPRRARDQRDRKSTRLNSSHRCISYAVFCLKKKKNNRNDIFFDKKKKKKTKNNKK